MNKIINKTVLLAALAIVDFACQSPELDTTALDTVIAEREALTVNRVQYVQKNQTSETFAITLASGGVSVSYNDTWQPTYYGHGYFIQFEATAPLQSANAGGMLPAGTYHLLDTAQWQISRGYVTVIHNGATSSTVQTLALTGGNVKVTEKDSAYMFDVDFTTILDSRFSGHSVKAEKITIEKDSFWFEPVAKEKVLKNVKWTATDFSFTYSENKTDEYSKNILTLFCDTTKTVVIAYNDCPWNQKNDTIPLKPFETDFYKQMEIKCPYDALKNGYYEPKTNGAWGGTICGDDIGSYILMGSAKESIYSDIYWVTNGKLDVTTSMKDNKEYLKIVADLETSNGSTIKVTYDEAAANKIN